MTYNRLSKDNRRLLNRVATNLKRIQEGIFISTPNYQAEKEYDALVSVATNLMMWSAAEKQEDVLDKIKSLSDKYPKFVSSEEVVSFYEDIDDYVKELDDKYIQREIDRMYEDHQDLKPKQYVGLSGKVFEIEPEPNGQKQAEQAMGLGTSEFMSEVSISLTDLRKLLTADEIHKGNTGHYIYVRQEQALLEQIANKIKTWAGRANKIRYSVRASDILSLSKKGTFYKENLRLYEDLCSLVSDIDATLGPSDEERTRKITELECISPPKPLHKANSFGDKVSSNSNLRKLEHMKNINRLQQELQEEIKKFNELLMEEMEE